MSTKDIEFAEQELARIKRSNLFMTSVYVFIALFVVVYVIWGSYHLNKISDENFLAQLTRYQIENAVINGSEPEIKSFMVDSLPVYTDQFLGQLKNKMPALREELNRELLKKLTSDLEMLQKRSHAGLDALLMKYDDDIKATIDSLENESEREALKALLTGILIEQYDTEFKKDIESITAEFRNTANLFDHLLNSPQEDLSAEEQEQRYALLLALANIKIISEEKNIDQLLGDVF